MAKPRTLTDAYLERMARRDDPNDHSVCEHNVDLKQGPCSECSPIHRAGPHHG